MFDLETIIAQNRRAVRLGAAKRGTLVGTANVEKDVLNYPWSIQPTMVGSGKNYYLVRNYETGFESPFIHETFEAAEAEGLLLQARGESL